MSVDQGALDRQALMIVVMILTCAWIGDAGGPVQAERV